MHMADALLAPTVAATMYAAYGVSSGAAEVAASIQDKTAILLDYTFADRDSPIGTTVSGLAGSGIVAAVAVLACMVGGFFRKKRAAAKS